MAYLKFIHLSILVAALLLGINTAPVNAQLSSGVVDEIDQQVTGFNDDGGAGFDTNVGVASIIQNVISAFLSLLGIIFIMLVLIGGYYWMTASGDEAKVTKAKDTIFRALIGLLIVVCAYSITYFVFNYLDGNNAIITGP